jgi:pre-rRNA-processing protein TSR4
MLPDDHSDSDESDLDPVQTSVLLGVPDGPISSPDLSKPRISRIGGPPVHIFLFVVYTPSCVAQEQ